MLKTRLNDKVWLVSQPDHGVVAGYLAAHWGNESFTRPGYYAEVGDPERLRGEVVLAVAEHDNGWWEWEAIPHLSEVDGYPLGLGELLRDQQEGMNRWRIGLSRFADRPVVNLLISHHAYWLYRGRLDLSPDSEFVHPLFWKGAPERLFKGTGEKFQAYVTELASMREGWLEELGGDESVAGWGDADALDGYGRLLQLLDGVSLSLCSALVPASEGETKGMGEDELEFRHVPRRGWGDRVTIEVVPMGGRRIALDPYPFDVDPLPVNVPVRVFDESAERAGDFATWWNGRPVEMLEFCYCSK